MQGRQLLICGPVIPEGFVGGLQIALRDLAGALAGLGWRVDLAITPEALDLPHRHHRTQQVEGLGGSRWSMLPRFRSLPDDARTLLQHLLLDGGVARLQSELLHALEARLRRHHYDAVIACVSREAPGLAHFVTACHPHALILSLNGVASELRLARWLALPRLASRVMSGRRLHPALYTPVDPSTIRAAVFASDAWRDEAVRAGLSPHAARTIYFGVADAVAPDSTRDASGRLLWVGRLSREKGLHAFIDAVALLRRKRSVSLTAVCAQGPADYRRAIERRIIDLGLRDVVDLRPAVPREDLLALYRQHDVLLFQSIFREPVALVVLEAFVAGLPVVAPLPARAGGLLRADRTAICYGSSSPGDISAAVERALDEGALRARVTHAARELALTDFSVEAMGRAYDSVLTELVAQSHVTAA